MTISKKELEYIKAQQHRKQRIFWQRIGMFLGGIVLVIVTGYWYNITMIREDILNDGKVVNAVISRVKHGRDSRIFVMDANQELDAGTSFGPYDKNEVGDTIKVHVKPPHRYAVLEGKSHSVIIALEYLALAFGIFLIPFSIFYPTEKILKEQARKR